VESLYLQDDIGPSHSRNPVLVAPPHRRARAARIRKEQHTDCDQYPCDVAAGCVDAERRRIFGSVRLCETPAEQGDCETGWVFPCPLPSSLVKFDALTIYLRYENVGEYRGSWNEWERRGGPGTKTPPKSEGLGEPTLPVQETKPVQGKGDSGEEDLGEQGGAPVPGGTMTPRQ
jgi:hypothetical protein